MFISIACYFFLTTIATSQVVFRHDEHPDGAEQKWFIEKKLANILTSQQDGRQLGRPVSNFTEPVVVEFGINLMQVMSVNESTGQLITNIWTHYRWRDPSLAWDRRAFGVDVVRIPADDIWKPDVTLFNYADDRLRQHRSTLAVVNSSGHITWIPTGIYKSACSIDTYSFPFDEQLCHLTFRSLSMGIEDLTLNFVDGREAMSLDSYVQNPEWEILENHAKRSVRRGKRGLQTDFWDLTFTLRLKRRSVFHRYVLILPCVLLSLTAGVLFILPPESPAKIQIGIFIFQGFFLLLNLLNKSIPAAGTKSPMIGLYYSTSMIATTVVMFFCGFLVELHFRADCRAPMSEMTRKIMLKCLARVLFIPVPKQNALKLHQLYKKRLAEQKSLQLLSPNWDVVLATSKSQIEQKYKNCLVEPPGGFSVSDIDELIEDFAELRRMFKTIAAKKATQEFKELITKEWLIVILVFDRLFFFAFMIYIVTSIYLFLPQEHVHNH